MKYIICLIAFISLLGCNKEIQNNVQRIKTEPIKKSFSVKTEDELNIVGNYFYMSAQKDSVQPLIILIHQFRSDKEQWDSAFIDTFLKNKYKVIAYDIRSHGESDKAKVDLMELLSDGQQAPKDLDAVIKWANEQKGINKDKIGIVGTSIGGSLGIYGAAFKGIKSVVAVSSGKGTFEAFTGYDERKMSMARPIPRIKNVMFVCGTKDGDIIDEEKKIYDNYLMDPREIMNLESDKHGKDLISAFPEIEKVIFKWFDKTL